LEFGELNFGELKFGEMKGHHAHGPSNNNINVNIWLHISVTSLLQVSTSGGCVMTTCCPNDMTACNSKPGAKTRQPLYRTQLNRNYL